VITQSVRPAARILVRTSRLAAVWAFAYGAYRWYYALGGTFGMLGTPASLEQWRRVNAIAGVLLFGAALLPILLVNAWARPRARPVLLALYWVIAVKTVVDPAVVESLIGRLTALTPETQRRWGTPTPHEMLCHLSDAAEMVLRVRRESVS
jgi:hypothetical protein